MSSFAPLDQPILNGNRSKSTAYFYDSDVGNYAYVAGHPMKPHRIRMAHSLIMNYRLYKHMEIYVSLQLSLVVRGFALCFLRERHEFSREKLYLNTAKNT